MCAYVLMCARSGCSGLCVSDAVACASRTPWCAASQPWPHASPAPAGARENALCARKARLGITDVCLGSAVAQLRRDAVAQEGPHLLARDRASETPMVRQRPQAASRDTEGTAAMRGRSKAPCRVARTDATAFAPEKSRMQQGTAFAPEKSKDAARHLPPYLPLRLCPTP